MHRKTGALTVRFDPTSKEDFGEELTAGVCVFGYRYSREEVSVAPATVNRVYKDTKA